MKHTFFAFLFFSSIIACAQQIDPKKIEIIRDSFGIPHIYADTDPEVAYGLAWAHCEDDFHNVQENLITGKGMMGRLLGKDGALFDFAMQFFSIDSFVAANFPQKTSPDFLKLMEAYVQGVNDFANTHPEQVRLKKALPFTTLDAMKSIVLQTCLLAQTGMALKAINDNRIEEYYDANNTGSNAMAIAPSKTEDGKTWLLINSHQPVEGKVAWYEAHVCSKQGWEMIGGLFPGGMTIFVGTNRHLGWAHTTNYLNFGDIYKLEINPDNKHQYKLDGKWVNFEYKTARLKIKLAGIVIGVKKKFPISYFGPVFEQKHGLYAIRFPSSRNLKAGEQWYRMNKATNLKEFEEAVKIQGVPLFNIVYGDRDGNIYFHSGGLVPDRDPSLKWNQPITAQESKYAWTKLLPYEKKPTLINPSCGFVYNCNQTPYHASGAACEWKGNFVGMQQFEYNRGEVLGRFLKNHEGKLSWNEFLKYKFDKSYHENGSYMSHFKSIYTLDETKYPDIADAIKKIKSWNLKTEVEDVNASFAMIMHKHLQDEVNGPFALLMIRLRNLTEEEGVEALRYTKKFMLKHYGSLDVKLGDIQRLQRGDVSFPASGGREVLRAADAKLYDEKKGLFRIVSGDGYIQLVRFGNVGDPEIFSINAFGASHHPDSRHYTDQMEMFTKEEFRTMTFDKNKILKSAEKVYYPGEIEYR